MRTEDKTFFEGYVRWLRLLLPKEQRDDIIRELTEEYASQVADREGDLGRSLTSDEEAAIVAQFGHPLLTAARYWPQRHLIGPALFPFYGPVLKIAAALVLAVNLVSAGVLLAGGAEFDAARWGQTLWTALLSVFFWFTMAFAAIDRALIRSGALTRWNPTMGPHAGGTGDAAVKDAMRGVDGALRGVDIALRGLKGSRGAPSMSGLVSGVILSAWWLLALKFPYLMFGGGAAILDWGPAMHRLYPVLVVAQLASLARHYVTLVRPSSSWLLRALRVVWIVNAPIFVYLLVTSNHQWVVWRGTAESRERFIRLIEVAGRNLSLVDLVNYAFSIAFVIAAVAAATWCLKAVWRGRAGGAAVHV